MRVVLFLLCILFFLSSSFCRDDEEKLLQQLHQKGEAAMQNQNYGEAKKNFEELSKKVSPTRPTKYRVDWITYVDVIIRLAQACEQLGENERASQFLKTLLAEYPPEDLRLVVQLHLARVSNKEECSSYALLKEVSKDLPMDYWKGEDRSLYHALEYSLNEHYDALIHKAKRYLTAGFYTEAIELYQSILKAVEKGNFPKITHQNALICKKIRHELAQCHYLAAKELDDPSDEELLSLHTRCFQTKIEYEQTLDSISDGKNIPYYDEALFEVGYSFYKKQDYSKAKKYFEKLQTFDTKPALVAALYLARLYLDEGQPEKVEKLLKPVSTALGKKDALYPKCEDLRKLAHDLISINEH